MHRLKQWVQFAYVAALIWFGLFSVPHTGRGPGTLGREYQFHESVWASSQPVAVGPWLVQLLVVTAIFAVLYFLASRAKTDS